jgi:enoyl-CoA hydratase/3-hydroxyacyl-CoA dehydrogenase
MGVFELSDYTGAVEIEILEDKHFKELREKYPEWEPHEEYVMFREYALKLSRKYYESGLIGVKTGKGFYQYPEPGKYVKPDIPENVGEKVEPLEILAPAINLVAWMTAHGITTPQESDLALKLGYNFPYGLIELGQKYGAKAVTEILEYKVRKYKDMEYSKFYNPHPALQDILK